MQIKKKSVAGLLLLGIIVGIFAVLGYDAGMAHTNTDEFCLSCHNHDVAYRELQGTVHYANASGVAAGCADCHMPPDFPDNVIRKIHASREVWGHITGIIDSEEKYLAHRAEMKSREVGRFQEWDSSPCKTCHDPTHMDFASQSAVARESHQNKSRGQTCIDCHQGLAHTPLMEEDDFDF